MTRAVCHLKANVVGYLALFIALGGTGAYAASSIVGPDGRLHGCYKKSGKGKGQLRVVKAKARCKRRERKIAWQQKGRDGVAGRAGGPGPRGPAGPPGATGPRGATGTVDTSNFYDKPQSDARFLRDTAGGADQESVADITRSINLPLTSFAVCDGSKGPLEFSQEADEPELFADGGSVALRFEHDGGSDDSDVHVCSQLTIPPDYASGGRLRIRATRANSNPNDRFSCQFRRDSGTAFQGPFDVSLTNPGTATYECRPQNTAAALPQANAGYGVTLAMESLTTAVTIHSIDFTYTSRQ